VERLSLGVQSFDDAELAFLGRNHDAAAALRAATLAGRTFPRLSLDLIYALPGQDQAAWAQTLEQAAGLGAGHISPYQLAIESGTAFDRAVRRGRFAPAGPDIAADLYEETQTTLNRLGFEAYEVSNHARGEAQRSRHNLAYWRYADYAGIGPGAHGRVTVGGTLRATRRHRAPEPWAERVERAGHGSTEETALQPHEKAQEMLLMGLRLTEGIDIVRFQKRTGIALVDAIDGDVLRQAIDAGYLDRSGERLTATVEGRLRLDALLGALVR
jgi:oxygen-independent coproporphyrinogen-3 oxidase